MSMETSVKEAAMKIPELLRTQHTEIVEEASKALKRAHLRGYEGVGEDTPRLRLQALCNRLTRCVETRQSVPLIRYVEETARKRFHSGVELFEVQTAMNALEEAIWNTMRRRMTPPEFVEAVGLLSSILGLGKDALARTYVSLASTRHAPTLDMRRLASVRDAAVPDD
jgi:hypothetical protein